MSLEFSHVQPWYQPISSTRTYWLPSTLILSIVFISLRPFSSGLEAAGQSAGGGDIVNQLGFGIMGIVCGVLMFKHASANVLTALSSPTWVLVLGVLILSVITADNPSGAMRAMMFSLIVILAAATALALPRNMSEMISALIWATFLTLCFCYIAVFIFPEQGIHSGGGYEAQHVGLWRGVYPHKNVASYVMGVIVMIGLFATFNGRPVFGLVITILSVIFVINAGSKTVLGILPISILVALTARWVTWSIPRLFIIILPVGGLFIATLGGIIYTPILDYLQDLIPGLTYTGRVDLWKFGLEYVRGEPWFGYGFESFWGTPRVQNLSQPIELSWDVRGIVHGHNSWMDATLAFGLPGTILVMIALVVLPVYDFLKIPNTGNAAKLSTLFISIWIFTALGACLESFFFRRSDPVWFCMILAIIGLRLTAHLSADHRYEQRGRLH